jgi:hypothetical protein
MEEFILRRRILIPEKSPLSYHPARFILQTTGEPFSKWRGWKNKQSSTATGGGGLI